MALGSNFWEKKPEFPTDYTFTLAGKSLRWGEGPGLLVIITVVRVNAKRI